MKDEMTRLVQQMVEKELTRLQTSATDDVPNKPAGIPFSELPEDTTDEPLSREWNIYRHMVGRWLTEGKEGRYVMIKGEEIIDIFDSWIAARQSGLKRFGRDLFFVHEIRAAEPHLNIRGINRPWPD